jgi:quercetin dioxygenase-like cupin family protein
MKFSCLIPALLIGGAALAQNNEYAITSYAEDGFLAPNTHYLGEAWLNFAMPADSTTGYGITKAMFKANSTLNWHKHGSVQVLIIVDGVGYYQERGKEPVIMKEGDIIKCQSGTEHWHSSSKEHDVTYLAIYGGSTPTEWTEELTREDYDAVAEKLANSK